MRLTMRSDRWTTARWALPVFVALAFGTACDDDDDDDRDAEVRLDAGAERDAGRERDAGARLDAGPDGAVGPDAGAPLTTAESAAAISAINAGEIEAATLAETRAEATEVRDYAAQMIADHTAAQQMLDALLEAQAITPAPNPVSQMVEAQTLQVVQTLTPLTGAEFDAAYMQSQEAMHTMALTLIDTRMLPGAEGDVRTLLMAFRAEIAEHLELAQSIIDAMGG